MKKVRVRLKKNNFITLLLTIFFTITFLYSGYKILDYLKDNYKNKKIQKTINDKIIKISEGNKYTIDFNELKKQNPDSIAYIKVNGTNINYVVVRGNDNSYYLKHNFNKEWNVSGWIFSDFRNKFDETDKNIVIFGHDTKDGSMFGTLVNILNNDWQSNKDNLKITLITEMGTYYYEVFSTYKIIPEDYYINTEFSSIDEFGEFVNTIKSRTLYDYKNEVTKDDKILTLSSCLEYGHKRVVLHAKLINKEENKKE